MSRTDKDRHWIIREHDRLTKPLHGRSREHFCHSGAVGTSALPDCTMGLPLKEKLRRLHAGEWYLGSCEERVRVADIRPRARRHKVVLRRQRRRVARQVLSQGREYPARLEWVRNAHHD